MQTNVQATLAALLKLQCQPGNVVFSYVTNIQVYPIQLSKGFPNWQVKGDHLYIIL